MYSFIKKPLLRLCQLSLLFGCMQAQSADLLNLAKDIKPNAKGLPAAFEKPLKISICFFDMQGTAGEFYSRAKDLALIARRWNIVAEFKVMPDENQVAESFRAGKCEAAVMSTLHARDFNKFMGSVDAIGAIPTYQHMRLVLKTLFDPKLEPFAISEPYQVVSIFPVGAQYLHVRDRSHETIDSMSNKKVAVLDWNSSLASATQQLGAQPVAASINDFARPFNKGEVDMLVAPSLVYWPYELQQGLGKTGGIYSTPLMQTTAALLINRELLKKKTPDLDSRVTAFHAITSEFLDDMLDNIFATIIKIEQEVPKKYWMILEPANEQKYQQAMRQARIQLTKEGVYDAKMMKVLKKVRCKIEPNAAECTATDE